MNLNEEIRNGYTITEQVKRLWAVQLEMVQILLDICNRHHLKIWGDSGTMIGAVREKGFIPWDDDIDMGMMRPDYDKLLEIAEQELPDNYFMQTAYSDVRYLHGHAQLRKRGTTCILPFDIDSPFHQGIFIDIFVYDGIPDDPEQLAQLRRQQAALREQLDIYCTGTKIWRVFSRPFFYFRRKRIEREVGQKGYCNLHTEWENLFRAHPVNQCKHVGALAFSFDRHVRFNMKTEDFSEIIYLPFEDMMMPVPKGYDRILTDIYGDYMRPAKTPAQHSGFELVDTEHDYTEHIDAVRKQFHRKKRIKRWKHILDKAIGYLTFKPVKHSSSAPSR